jgi:hypothetical protein
MAVWRVHWFNVIQLTDKNLCIKALVHSIRTFSNPFFSASVFLEKLPIYLQHQASGPLVIKDVRAAVLPGHNLMDVDDEEDLTGAIENIFVYT